MPPALAADAGLIIFLLVVTGVAGLFIRTISRKSMNRLESGGTGAETVRDRERRRSERIKRKEDEARARDAEVGEDGGADERPKGAPKRRRGKKGQKRSGKIRPRKGGAADAPAPKAVVEKPKLLLGEGTSLGEGLSRTRSQGFIGRLGKLFQGKQIDDALLDEVEEVLFTADIGVRTADRLLAGLRKKASAKELSDADAVWRYLKSEAQSMLDGVEQGRSMAPKAGETPYVVLVVGVNGSGKTTTIGKLAHRLGVDGKKVLVGAGDTFRAAAVEQLEVWARRVGAEVVTGKEGADPSSVLFDAVRKAKDDHVDAVLLDTAGRLHTNTQLLAELKKVGRVIDKALPGAPHEVLLVLDATNGQNAIAQAKVFGEALGVNGIVLTKLDGTAKGGVVLGIYDELRIPIRWIGVGERTEDLRVFDKREFVDALFEGV